MERLVSPAERKGPNRDRLAGLLRLGDRRQPQHALFYLTMAFQALFGLDVWTVGCRTRSPGSQCLLAYHLGTRLFDRRTGLVAAGLLAIHPWHLQQSRWGIESGLLVCSVQLALAAWMWAGLPPESSRSPRAGRALVAGALAGAVCYGYPAGRLFIVGLRAGPRRDPDDRWRALLARADGRRAAGALVLGLLLTLGPLAWKHATDPEIGRRASYIGSGSRATTLRRAWGKSARGTSRTRIRGSSSSAATAIPSPPRRAADSCRGTSFRSSSRGW